MEPTNQTFWGTGHVCCGKMYYGSTPHKPNAPNGKEKSSGQEYGLDSPRQWFVSFFPFSKRRSTEALCLHFGHCLFGWVVEGEKKKTTHTHHENAGPVPSCFTKTNGHFWRKTLVSEWTKQASKQKGWRRWFGCGWFGK